ncbi:MAG: alcohol dehydrogenase [Reyranellaceae bacterium]
MKSYDIADFGAPLALSERPTPQPRGTEVLLKVLAAGMCHSDVHMWEGYFDMGGGRKLTQTERGLKLPHTMGHEIAGELVAFGPDAAAAAEVAGLKPGGRYLVYPWVGCGRCEVCRDGDEQLCLTPRFIGLHVAGGYADHVIVCHPRYLVDIEDLSPAEAALFACSGLTAYGALRKLGDRLQRSPTVIVGAGGLGLMALNLHRAMKGKAAVVVDVDPAKRAAALAAGAAAAIDGAAADAVQQIKQAVGGPVFSIVDLVGSGQTLAMGIDCLTKSGKLVVVGLFGGKVEIPTPLIPQKAMTIQGSYVGSLQELRDLLQLVRRTRMPSIPIDRRALNQADAALRQLQAGRVLGRVVLAP